MKDYLLGLYEKAMPKELDWKAKLEAMQKAGFDYLEISIDETDEKLERLDYSLEKKLQLKRVLEQYSASIGSICLSGHRRFPLGSKDSATRQRSLEVMQKAIDFASFFGIRCIQLAGYDVYYEDGDAKTKAYFVENLGIASQMASRAGVNLGFETMETPFMDTVAKAMTYVDLIDSPYLGIYPDLGNLMNASLIYQEGIVEDLQSGRGKIMAAHLKETIPNHYREIPFGTGHTPYVDCLRELKKQNVRRFVGEFWYIGSPDWEADLEFANTFLRSHLDQVF